MVRLGCLLPDLHAPSHPLPTPPTPPTHTHRGYTVCHVAAQYGQTAILHHLALKWDANMDELDNDGRLPLHWAAYKGFAGAGTLSAPCITRCLCTQRASCLCAGCAA